MSVVTIHDINLDYHYNTYVSINDKQYDSGVYIDVQVLDNGQFVPLTEYDVIEVRVETPDKRHIRMCSNERYQLCESTDSGAVKVVAGNKNLDTSVTPNEIGIDNYALALIRDQLQIEPTCYVREGTASLFTVENGKVKIHFPQSVYLKNGKGVAEIRVINGNQLSTMNLYMNIVPSVYDESTVIDDAFTTSEIDTLRNEMKGYMQSSANSADLSREWAIGMDEVTAVPSNTNNSYYYSERSRIYMDTKADQTTVDGCIKSIEFNEDNGEFTITFVNNTTKKIDTNIEKIAINFSYDKTNEKLILYDLNGAIIAEIDLSSLISEYDFQNSDTIQVTEIEEEGSDKNFKFEVIEGSIQEKHIAVDYVSEIREAQRVTNENAEKTAADVVTTNTNVQSSKNNSLISEGFATGKQNDILQPDGTYFENNAKYYKEQADTRASEANTSAIASESYAVGGTGSREGEDTDNAKYYCEQSVSSKNSAAASETNAHSSATSAANSAKTAISYTVGGTDTREGENTNNAKYYKETANEYYLKSEGYAVGEQNGTAVESGDYYQNNAKYYNELAKASAELADEKADEVLGKIDTATTSATNAENSAKESKSYAVGGTGSRTGEDTDNAKYYNTQAHACLDITAADVVSTNTNAESALTSKNTAQSYAVGGTSTRAGEDSDNAKYYKEQSQLSSLKSEGYSIGTQDGVTMLEGEYYQNNAKYYKEHAASSANTAIEKANLIMEHIDEATTGATTATNKAAEAISYSLISEGFAIGSQNGEEVTEGTYFQNNSKYWAKFAEEQAKSVPGTDVIADIQKRLTSIENEINPLLSLTEEDIEGWFN